MTNFSQKINDEEKKIKDYIMKAFENPFVNNKMNELKKYDKCTFYHSVNVTVESLRIALNDPEFNADDYNNLTVSALLHDIGKIKIPVELLKQKENFTKKEFSELKKHAEYGAAIIEESKLFDKEVSDAVLMHHENFNNTGYYKISHEKISKYAYIIRIADTFDAMTSNRPYHNARKPDDVINQMMWFSDEFNPYYFDIFVNKIENHKKIYFQAL